LVFVSLYKTNAKRTYSAVDVSIILISTIIYFKNYHKLQNI